jgi:6-phosphogluconate dehydrogenase
LKSPSIVALGSIFYVGAFTSDSVCFMEFGTLLLMNICLQLLYVLHGLSLCHFEEIFLVWNNFYLKSVLLDVSVDILLLSGYIRSSDLFHLFKLMLVHFW